MKNAILISIFVVFITGCTSLLPADYDNNEYAGFAQLEALARTAYPVCNDPDKVRPIVGEMKAAAEYLYTYTRYLPGNEETNEVADIIRENITEMRNRYNKQNPSKTYCELKLRTLVASTQRALIAVGKKIRRY